MKILVSLKDPDGFSTSVDEAVRASVQAQEGLADDERDDVIERRTERTWEALGKFVSYQEYVTIEFDTDEGTAVVQPRRDR